MISLAYFVALWILEKLLIQCIEDIKVPFELRAVTIRLYEKVISKIKDNEGWKTYINCNIGVKQGCPLSPTIFCIYIDKLEKCLEEAGCADTILAGI